MTTLVSSRLWEYCRLRGGLVDCRKSVDGMEAPVPIVIRVSASGTTHSRPSSSRICDFRQFFILKKSPLLIFATAIQDNDGKVQERSLS